MGLEDVLGKTTDSLTAMSKKKGKDKRPLFSFGGDTPSFASDDGAGDVRIWIPSGITMLDYALGGGLPVGRISEVFSDNESEGKTTTLLHFVVSVQRAGGAVIWLESESAMDKPRAQGIGVDLSNMIIWSPDTLEDGFRFINDVIQKISEDKDLKDKPTLIVWDTIAMARTEAERDGDAFRDGIGAAPRTIATALKNYTQELYKYNVHLCLVNQSYTNINTTGYGGPGFETPGGKRIKFASSVRIHLRRGSTIGDKPTLGREDEKLGIISWATTRKNKLALANRTVPMALYGKTGLNDIMTLAYAWNDGPYKWAEGLKSGGGWYQPIHCDSKVRWCEIEEAVRSNPATLGAWKQRAFEIFPVHPSRQLNPDGWFERTAQFDVSEFNLRKGLTSVTDAPGPTGVKTAAEYLSELNQKPNS